MKRIMFFLCVLFLATGVPLALSAAPSLQAQADALMQKWRTAISQEDVDGYAGCYWPDATNQAYDKKGQSTLLTGAKALRDRQQEWSNNLDFSTFNMTYPEPSRFVPASGDMCVYAYLLEQFSEMEIFYFQLRGGELRILRQIDLWY
jgi:ketosteroid isomerase-like protein